MKKTNGRKVEEQRKHDGKRSTMSTDKDGEYNTKFVRGQGTPTSHLHVTTSCAKWLSVRLM